VIRLCCLVNPLYKCEAPLCSNSFCQTCLDENIAVGGQYEGEEGHYCGVSVKTKSVKFWACNRECSGLSLIASTWKK